MAYKFIFNPVGYRALVNKPAVTEQEIIDKATEIKKAREDALLDKFSKFESYIIQKMEFEADGKPITVEKVTIAGTDVEADTYVTKEEVQVTKTSSSEKINGKKKKSEVKKKPIWVTVRNAEFFQLMGRDEIDRFELVGLKFLNSNNFNGNLLFLSEAIS